MRLLLLAPVALVLFLAACGGDNDSSSGRVRVVATTTQIGDFARQVGGDRISLTVLLRPNQDAHDFQLQPSQLRALSDADAILVNGLGLDSFVDQAIESAKRQPFVVTQGITPREAVHDEAEDEHDHDEDGHGDADPHVWFSVANARRMVENVRDALAAVDSENATFYRENAASYLRELDELESSIRREVAQVPAACRKLVTNHDVLGYFAEAYGFEVVGSVVPGTTTAAGASAADIARVVQLIRAERVPAIFAETSANPALMQQVAREAGVRLVDDLYGDSLGPSGSDGATYIQMMQANTAKITGALKDCSV